MTCSYQNTISKIHIVNKFDLLIYLTWFYSFETSLTKFEN